MNQRTAIVIVSYNAKEFLKENIASIRRTVESNYKIFVVDNASTDGVREWLLEEEKNHEDISVICNDRNEGFPKACNQGVSATIGSVWEEADVFLLNNDTRLCDNSLANLIQALYSEDQIGAVGGISNYAGNNQQIDLSFSFPEDYVKFGNRNNIPYSEETKSAILQERVRLSGFAMLIKRAVFDKVGGMDEAFTPGYFEDDDLSMKISLLGKKLLLCKNSFIYHAGSQSFSKVKGIDSILTDHYQKFINKYGFPILDIAYPDEKELDKIPYDKIDRFTFLEIGCGLGANMKCVSSRFQNAEVYGIEPEKSLRDISVCTENIFSSVEAFVSNNSSLKIDVVYLSEAANAYLTDDDISLLSGMFRENTLVLPNNQIDFRKVKLVIWDLDNTFWDGVLSEGEIVTRSENIKLIKDLTDCGIINSISSKNEEAKVREKLTELGIFDYFVFNNINWENKGEQIKEKIASMNLRAENVLFIDDEVHNLEEADYLNEGIIASDPLIIPELINFVSYSTKTDMEHKRLESYKLLETKRSAQSKSSSKEQFLYESEVRIDIIPECEDYCDRISDLVARSNQLNYTKIRDSKEEIEKLVKDKHLEKGVIKARDKFGDYGVIGFYCYDNRGELRHFLFSCRVIGMGIEQKIYMMLGCPELTVVRPVAVELNDYENCDWITTNLDEALAKDNTNKSENGIRILLKGPCDLSAIESYLQGGNVTTEFNFVNEQGFVTTGQNHTMNIVQGQVFKDEEIIKICSSAPFITIDDFKTDLFEKEYDVIVLSLLPDCEAGYYKNKSKDFYIPFGSKNFDLTDKANEIGFIEGKLQNHGFKFTKDIINEFRENWQFVKYIPVEETIKNLNYICDNVKGNPLIVLFLGSEIECELENEEFANLATRHKIVNATISDFASNRENIRVINATDYIKSQEDYIDCINHYARNVYYDMASSLVSFINEKVEEIIDNRINQTKDFEKYDSIIMTVPNDYKRMEHFHDRLVKTMPSKKLFYVGNSDVGELINNTNRINEIGHIDENSILPFSDVHSVMEDALKEVLLGRELPRGVTGWYYQQFLKMEYSRICQDKYYLVWDGDTVPCAAFRMFDDKGNPYFDLKTEYHEEYFTTISKLLPGMGKVIAKSFISEHMIIRTDFMKELIEAIEENDSIKGEKFYEKIIYSIEPEKLLSNSFSEFETYGTFVALKHTYDYKLRDWHSFRYGGDFFDSKKIDETDFRWLAKDFEAISFEKNHEVREDHKNLFDNKDYQKKLSARQMLEIAQEEFEGDSFKESWD